MDCLQPGLLHWYRLEVVLADDVLTEDFLVALGRWFEFFRKLISDSVDLLLIL